MHSSVATARPDVETCVVAMTDTDRTYGYPAAVRLQIHEDETNDYVRAAEFLKWNPKSKRMIRPKFFVLEHHVLGHRAVSVAG